ncbi:transposase-like protein [Paraburkholderia sp. GAS348]
MAKHRTPYPAELRAQMVELVEAGRTPEELEKEFEPTAQTGRDVGTRLDGLATAEREELRRLRHENRQLRLEREILSKTAAWCAYKETGTAPPKGSDVVHIADATRASESRSGRRSRYRCATPSPGTKSSLKFNRRVEATTTLTTAAETSCFPSVLARSRSSCPSRRVCHRLVRRVGIGKRHRTAAARPTAGLRRQSCSCYAVLWILTAGWPVMQHSSICVDGRCF